MTQRGKKYIDATRRFDRAQVHSPAEALGLVKSLSSRNFDETVEAAFRLGVDPRKADQMIRGAVSLPNGTGKTVRVAVFAQGPGAQEAKDAGADVVGADDLIERIQGGFLDFDIAIATPDLMGKVGKLGRMLGPRGLMPNPKTGTVTQEVGKAVSDFKGGRIEYRTDRYGNVHMPIGKASFTQQALIENYQAGLDELLRVKPAAAKGRYIKGVTVSSTMGPGVRVDPTKTRDLLEEVPSPA
jgi:large subunit ribosomal protein L1